MRSHVCVCALLSFSPVLSCVHFCYKCRSCWCLRAAPLLQNIGEEKSYNVFLKLFSTIFHRYACAGVCLCVTVSAVCVWLWSVDSFAGRVQTSALLLGAATTMANYYLFFFLFRGKRWQDFSFNRETASESGGQTESGDYTSNRRSCCSCCCRLCLVCRRSILSALSAPAE